MADFALQRMNMVESQVRPSDVTDRRILKAMQDIPRERFVPGALGPLAYMDSEVPLGGAGPGRPGRALMAPRLFAKLVQLAEIEAGDTVLDVGCATGYSAAVLGKLAQTIVALETDARLAAEARRVLGDLRTANVTVAVGDLVRGYPDGGPYDAIVIEGAVAEAPAALLNQLRDGGRLATVLAGANLGKAVLWRRRGQACDRTAVFDAGAPLLPGFELKPTFSF
jgi:protein-L-isoaspartate(D-aspartate) O-methyltransferase